MKENQNKIIVSAELIMYGSVTICLEDDGNKCITSYIAIADGGPVASRGEKEYDSINTSELIDRITSNFSTMSEEDDGVIWKLFCAKEEIAVVSIDENSWGRDKLLSLIELIQSYIKDDEPLADLKELALF